MAKWPNMNRSGQIHCQIACTANAMGAMPGIMPMAAFNAFIKLNVHISYQDQEDHNDFVLYSIYVDKNFYSASGLLDNYVIIMGWDSFLQSTDESSKTCQKQTDDFAH